MHIVLILVFSAFFYQVDSSCDQSLGVGDERKVKNNQFSASSHLFDHISRSLHYQAHYARLNNQDGGGAWCSANDKSRNHFVEIDFKRNKFISAILSQGRYKGAEYVTHFKITYQRDMEMNWREIINIDKSLKVFLGNNDTSTIATNTFPFPIAARKIRIHPLGDLFNIYCMRIDLLGCSWNKDFLMEYEAPLGVQQRGFEFRDLTYDGTFDPKSNRLRGGLGELTDSNYGEAQSIKTVSFVGYNTTDVEILFKLSEMRLVERMSFLISNIESLAELFTSLVVEVSEDKKSYRMVSFTRGPTKLERYKSKLTISPRLSRTKGMWIKAIFKQRPNNLLLISEVDITTSSVRLVLPTRNPLIIFPKTKAYNTDSNDMRRTLISRLKEPTPSWNDFGNMTGDGLLTPVSSDNGSQTKSFFIIIGVAILLFMILIIGIGLLVWHLRRDRKKQKRMVIARSYPDGKPSSCESTLCEPLLKATGFQGPAGTSTYITPEGISTKGFPTERELPRSAIDFSQRFGGGKHGEIFSGQIVAPKGELSHPFVNSLLGQRIHVTVMKKGASMEASAQYYEEIRELACLNHVNVCRLIGVCTNSEPIFVVLEASDSMRLDKYLYSGLQQESKNRRLDILNDIARQISSALVYLSSLQFTHRDIAVRNVLCNSDGTVKLSNTAAASPTYYDCYYFLQERNGLYPIRWMAPESVARLHFSIYSDIWSFGVMLWEMYMLGSNKPLSCLSDNRVTSLLKEMHETGDRGQDYLQCPHGCPMTTYQLMRQCWAIYPENRIKAKDVYNTLCK